MHTRERDRSLEERHSAFNCGSDEAPFTSGVLQHTPPDLAVSILCVFVQFNSIVLHL